VRPWADDHSHHSPTVGSNTDAHRRRDDASRTTTEEIDVSLPQRSTAPTLTRPVAYGQRPAVGNPAMRPMAMRPATGHPMAAAPVGQRPVVQRPAPRPVSFLTVTEVAAIMRVSKMTVYRLVHAGELAAVRVGRSFRVPEPAVRDYLAGARTDVA
jgi:excisionase family DNA binding protein